MRKAPNLLAAVLGVAVYSLPRVANAALTEKTGMFAGATVTYEVVTPSGFDPARAYPAVLVFPGGPQTQRMARTEAERWRSEPERRGYIIVSPETLEPPRSVLDVDGVEQRSALPHRVAGAYE